ncbi:hypothetical protein BJG94_16450 [Rhizobium sp. Td3]|nr:hypothetical protein BJG94_16450 [Rhizobium sp. Td3]
MKATLRCRVITTKFWRAAVLYNVGTGLMKSVDLLYQTMLAELGQRSEPDSIRIKSGGIGHSACKPVFHRTKTRIVSQKHLARLEAFWKFADPHLL